MSTSDEKKAPPYTERLQKEHCTNLKNLILKKEKVHSMAKMQSVKTSEMENRIYDPVWVQTIPGRYHGFLEIIHPRFFQVFGSPNQI